MSGKQQQPAIKDTATIDLTDRHQVTAFCDEHHLMETTLKMAVRLAGNKKTDIETLLRKEGLIG